MVGMVYFDQLVWFLHIIIYIRSLKQKVLGKVVINFD